MFHVVNGLIFALIVVGVLLHRRPRLHVPWMLTCFGLDLLLLLSVELTGDSAVITTTRRMAGEDATHRMWTMIHVGFSVTFLAMWIWSLFLGRRLLRDRSDAKARRLFRILAVVFLLSRLGNVLTAPLIV